MAYQSLIKLLVAVGYLVAAGACTPSPLESARALECHDELTLKTHQALLRDITKSYCTNIFSELAPKAPLGIKAEWTRVNPYPALPDYFLYPDTSPMQINGKRLQRVASCMHKRCLELTKTPQRYCGDANCAQNKGDFILQTFLDLARECTAEPYTQRRIAENVRNLYNTLEEAPLDLCRDVSRTNDADLKIVFGETIDACSPVNNDCPLEQICTQEVTGNRCRPIAPTALPQIPGVHFTPDIPRQKRGAPCQLSKECKTGLVCGHAIGSFGTCAEPCSNTKPCPDQHFCYQISGRVSFCNKACAPQINALNDTIARDHKLCVPAASSGRTIDVQPTRLAQAIKKQPDSKQLNDLTKLKGSRIDEIILSMDTSSTCGNGKFEAPEFCDSGAQNGQPKRGAWCTDSCTLAECGNNVRESEETCECTLGYEDAFFKSQELQRLYQLPTTCPGRYATTDGSEKALGFTCHNCTIVHARHMRDTRQNPYFLPEFDPFNPPETENDAEPIGSP